MQMKKLKPFICLKKEKKLGGGGGKQNKTDKPKPIRFIIVVYLCVKVKLIIYVLLQSFYMLR